MALAEYQSHAFRAFGGIISALLPRDVLWRAGVIIFCIVAVFVFTQRLSVTQALLIVTTVLAGVTFGQAISSQFTRPQNLIKNPKIYEIKEWKQASLRLWGIAIVNSVLPPLTVVILGIFSSPNDIAHYFAAIRISMILSLFVLASNMVVSPMIAKSFARNDITNMRLVCKVSAICVSLLTTMSAIIILTLGKSILNLFGEGYSQAYFILCVLCLGTMINAFTGVCSATMTVSGHEKQGFKIICFVNISAFILLFPLVSFYGVLGGAITLVASQVVWNVACVVFLRKTIGIDTSILSIFSSPKIRKEIH